MKLKGIFCLILFLNLVSFSAFSLEDDPLTVLLKKLEEFTKRYPQEKVHLHLDKPYYAIGDDIWFKAYVIDSRTSSPSTISNILYVELIGEDNSIKRQLRLPMQNGTSWGDFKLVDTLAEGNYRIRAYTQWMRNMGPQFFFDKTIKIGNSWANLVSAKTQFSFLESPTGNRIKAEISLTDSLEKPLMAKDVAYEIQLEEKKIVRGKGKTNQAGQITLDFPNSKNKSALARINLVVELNENQKIVKHIPIKSTSEEIDLQFFPEGGNMVDGINSRIAIKAINANGLGQNVAGTIIDNEGVEAAKFETTYLGMGSFILRPLAGKKYTAKFKAPNQSEQSVPLPASEKSGYTLMAYDIDSASIGVKISISNDLLKKGDLNFISHHNGKAYTVATIPSSEKASLIVLTKKELPSGILQLTLFSPSNLPICERLVFINNVNDTVNLQLQNLKSTYAKRENVDLSLVNSTDKPVWADFSVSVTNTSIVIPDLENESNILTTLLLTSDLTGYVEKPNHYFLKNDVKTRNELDHLLLTQGWRKINWKAIDNPQLASANFKPEKELTISGSISSNGGKPMSQNKITLLSKSNGLLTLDTLSNDNGNFLFRNLSFPEKTKIILQAKIKKEKDVLITIDTIPQQMVNPVHNLGDIEVNVNEKLKPYLTENRVYQNDLTKRGILNHTIQLKEVDIIGKQVNPAKNSANLNGPGNADYVVDVSDILSTTPLDAFLQGRVPGITLKNGLAYSLRKPGTIAKPYYDKKGKLRVAEDTMKVVVDGMFMDNDFNLRELNANDLESIEVLTSVSKLAIYGSKSTNGILIVTTKKGKSTGNTKQEAPGIISYLPKGYYLQREFYSPKYSVEEKPKPDLRSTIYWNPTLTIDEKGTSKFNYFNADLAGVYRIVLEGFDAFGNLARKVYTYEVK